MIPATHDFLERRIIGEILQPSRYEEVHYGAAGSVTFQQFNLIFEACGFEVFFDIPIGKFRLIWRLNLLKQFPSRNRFIRISRLLYFIFSSSHTPCRFPLCRYQFSKKVNNLFETQVQYNMKQMKCHNQLGLEVNFNLNKKTSQKYPSFVQAKPTSKVQKTLRLSH